MEKLRGLKLGTSERDLTANPSNDVPFANPLSPESTDVAVSSFAAFKGANPSALAAKPPQAPQQPARKVAVQVPPPSIMAQQQQQPGHSGMASMDAFTAAPVPSEPVFQSRGAPLPEDDKDEGLFALPISPRSPEMGKSPFSFAGGETARYVKGESTA
jgi:hypothetical protein